MHGRDRARYQRLIERLDGDEERTERRQLLLTLLDLQQRVNRSAATRPERDNVREALDRRAASAVVELGSVPIATWSLRDYDSSVFGPLLGVSDDGQNTHDIVRAFLRSPKSEVLRSRGLLDDQTIGAAVDAERISAAGELLVGPSEYAAVWTSAASLVAMTTNVGSIVLPRFYRAMPFVTVVWPPGSDPDVVVNRVTHEVVQRFEAFVHAVSGQEITVFVTFRGADRVSRARKLSLLSACVEAVDQHLALDTSAHRIGLLQRFDGRTSTAPRFAIGLAREAGLTEVMLEGNARYESQDQLLLPGLLAYFSEAVANRLLKDAREAGVAVRTKNRIDTGTAARTIWSGLSAARGMGLHLGKFGLFPLTFDEQIQVLDTIRPWFNDWTPTPAFYVDRPMVTPDGIKSEGTLKGVALDWISGVARAGYPIALIDSPDRTPAPAGSGRRSWADDRGRRLIKRPNDGGVGVLSLDEVREILDAAGRRRPHVRILLAGGLSANEAAELVKAGAFGIFTTSTTARRVAAGAGDDPAAAERLQPTHNGVLAMKMVTEAAFLAVRLGRARSRAQADDQLRRLLLAADDGVAKSGDEGSEMLGAIGADLRPLWEEQFDRVGVR